MNEADRRELKALIRETLAEFLSLAVPPPRLEIGHERSRNGVPYSIRAAAAMEDLQRKTAKIARRM